LIRLGWAKRRAAVNRARRDSGQVQVAGADRFFTGTEKKLVPRARQFLDASLKR
jgi:hypothetical protein